MKFRVHNFVEVKASSGYPVHNLDTGLNYTTIQAAISAPETKDGHTIRVDAGTYFEHVTIAKSIFLFGENRDTTIIDGSGIGTVIRISTSGVSMKNFTVRNAGRNWGPPPGYGYPDSCVLGTSVMSVHVENATFNGAAVCVAFIYSSSISVSNSTVSNATYIGVLGYASNDVTVYNNLVFDYGSEGIHLDGGSSHCRVMNNTVKNGFDGISLEKSAVNNLIDGNYLSNNTLTAIGIWKCGTNVFRRNNMTSNNQNLVVWGYDLANFMQDIDDSNTADDKILYYLTNRDSLLIAPSNYPNLGYIAIVNCTNITIRDFNLTSNKDGILLASSTNCTLMNITLSDNRGPLIYGGFSLVYGGLTFFGSNNNTIVNSRICNNSYGVCLYHSDSNIFYHNSFLGNNRQVVSDFLSPFSNTSSGYHSVSVWDNGYPSGGNHWSDYIGNDTYSGAYQNEAGSDGIGDTPHIIDASNTDHYPLMGEFHSNNITNLEHSFVLELISNSTISNFDVGVCIEHPENRIIHFSVFGETGYGFCRLCIPKTLISPPYNVTIDNGQTPVIYYDENLFDNGTHRWIYFTYQHSEHQVEIVPEFPSFILLPLFMFTTLLVVTAYRRKHVI